jgi:hypothetical protein
MSRKSELKKARRAFLQAGLQEPTSPGMPTLEEQIDANLARDTAAIIKSVGNGFLETEATFTVRWPDGAPGTFDDLNLSRFGFDCMELTAAGRWALRFPKPFEHIVILNGEEVTLQRARDIHQAAIALGLIEAAS